MEKNAEVSKLNTDCAELAKASYRCTETKTLPECHPFFEAYKACRRDEHKRIIDSRRNGTHA